MSQFSFPSATPLERLRIYDSLTINAQRWLSAHEYHRRRQNVVYQSLYQPGIVFGLGVKVIDPPTNSRTRNNERRWIEIQPGIAIDIFGNPIIVDQEIDRTYRIAATAPATGITVYLVIKYVDPDSLEQQSSQETVKERFRLDQITRPPLPEDGEVELCRIHVQPGVVNLELPQQPWTVVPNQIDLRYRTQVQARPLTSLRVGVLSSALNQINENLQALVQSLPALFPNLEVTVYEPAVNLNDVNLVNSCNLLYLNSKNISQLNDANFDVIRNFIANGGVILVETDVTDTAWKPRLLNDLLTSSEYFIPWQSLSSDHPLAKQPFLFTDLPSFYGKKIDIQISNNYRLIIVTEPLSQAWSGLGSLPRHDIRVAHELGINILHFAANIRNFTQLLQ